jgi:hypothetical protein
MRRIVTLFLVTLLSTLGIFVTTSPAKADNLSATINSVGQNGMLVAGYISLDISFSGGPAIGGQHCLAFIQANQNHLNFKNTVSVKSTVVSFAAQGIEIVDKAIDENGLECKLSGYYTDNFKAPDTTNVWDATLEVLWDSTPLASKPFRTYDWQIQPKQLSILTPANATTGAGLYELTLSEPDSLFKLDITTVCVDKVGQQTCSNGSEVQNTLTAPWNCQNFGPRVIKLGTVMSLGQYSSGKAIDASHVTVAVPDQGNYVIFVRRDYYMPYEAFPAQRVCYSSSAEIIVNNQDLGSVSPNSASWNKVASVAGIDSATTTCGPIAGNSPPYGGETVECEISLTTFPHLVGSANLKLYGYPPGSSATTSSQVMTTTAVKLGSSTKFRFKLPEKLDSNLQSENRIAFAAALEGSSQSPLELLQIPVNGLSRPTISGTFTTGSPLTASWDIASTDFYNTYIWLRDGVDIPGANQPTYVPKPSDAGHNIGLKIYSTNPLASGLVGRAIEQTIQLAPALTIAGLKAYGTPNVGSVLKVAMGPFPDGTVVTFQWLRNGTAIPGARSSIYKIKPMDRGKGISVRISAVNQNFTSSSGTSAAIKVR